MYGVPDSITYGAYKRVRNNHRKARRVRRNQNPIGQIIFWAAFVVVVVLYVL